MSSQCCKALPVTGVCLTSMSQSSAPSHHGRPHWSLHGRLALGSSSNIYVALQAILAESSEREGLDVELAASGFGQQHQQVCFTPLSCCCVLCAACLYPGICGNTLRWKQHKHIQVCMHISSSSTRDSPAVRLTVAVLAGPQMLSIAMPCLWLQNL